MNRPKTRGECVDGPRPCPWVSCRYNLLVHTWKSGTINLLHGGQLRMTRHGTPEDLAHDEIKIDAAIERWHDEGCESCALDVADRGETGFLEIGRMLDVTKEMARKIVEKALPRMTDVND